MQFKFTFKHLEPLESITNYAKTHFERLDKLGLGKEMKVHFIFSVQKADQTAEVLVDNGHSHYTATAKDPTLYAAIDKVVEKMERQLKKHKEMIQTHKHFDVSKEGFLRKELADQAKALRMETEEDFQDVPEGATRKTS